MSITYLFWIIIGLVAYTYLGYFIVLWLYCKVFKRKTVSYTTNPDDFPEITIVIAAHNEELFVKEKIENTLSLSYPPHKITQLWVDDGSEDQTLNLLKNNNQVKLIVNRERVGKSESLNRAMQQVSTPITLFTDANTFLSANSALDLVKHFTNPRIGCVAGQKRVVWNMNNTPASKGEGVYWQYESAIKQVESCTGSTLSGTGELYAIRTELYKPLPANTILDDLEICANIIKQGFTVKYENSAIATELGSPSIAEEKKRKVRIAAGCFQSLKRHLHLLNPFKKAEIAFKFFSHKFLRWVVVPPSAIILPVLNLGILLSNTNPKAIYIIIFIIISIFYGLVAIGFALRNRIRIPYFLTLPYYGFMMNVTMIKGLLRFLQGKQSTLWEKVNRKAGN